ncbi:hypothetical protein GO730_29425 [Spirosoma sp. HMF3257]|nr:hypothetical protein [Spirosoma telluris]
MRLAVDAGYYDYPQLVPYFSEFTTVTPNEFLQQDSPVLKCAYDRVNV